LAVRSWAKRAPAEQTGFMTNDDLPAEVKRLARLAVFKRPGYQVPPGDALDVRMTPLPISGSDIRARAARGESLDGLVPAPVANYIIANKLYR